MNSWQQLSAICIVAVLAFLAGQAKGLRDCPGIAANEAAMEEAAQDDVAFLLRKPTDRQQRCDKIFEIVQRGLSEEKFLYDQETSMTPDTKGE